MREVRVDQVADTVSRLFMEANIQLDEDVLAAFEQAIAAEESPTAREVLRELQENARIALQEHVPMCQDTGLAVVFVEMGQDVHIVGGYLYDAIQEGVRRGYRDGYLRKSACHPFSRANTGDNTPAIIHLDVVPGDRLRIMAVPKGGGSENMSRVMMLTPAAGKEGIVDYVIQRVRESGSNPCPPIIVGVGIGGTFEKAALLAKKALLRPLGSAHADGEMADLEAEMLRRINDLGIGPQGYGGRTTALGVHVEVMPCHIASLPVAVNIQCHASRHKEAVL
jgi:fumarate hydratase subunit alpha